MISNNIKVSIVIPVFNLEKYIGRCLNSVRSQTLHDIEILVIDDGSTDKSLKIIKEHARDDYRIKYVRQQNLGVSSARNKGIEMAKGSYITFIDGDDYIAVEMLEEMITFAELQKMDITFCHFSNFEYNKTGLSYTTSPENFVKEMFEGKVQRSACGILFNLQLINKNSLTFDVDMSYGEDFLFSIKAILLTQNKIGIVRQAYYTVEQRPGSAIRTMNPNQYQCVQLLAQRIDEVFEQADLKCNYEILLQRYYFSDILLSVSHIIKSKTSLFNKFTKLRELKQSSHARNALNIKFHSSFSLIIKAILIKYTPSPMIWFIYVLSNRLKGG